MRQGPPFVKKKNSHKNKEDIRNHCKKQIVIVVIVITIVVAMTAVIAIFII